MRSACAFGVSEAGGQRKHEMSMHHTLLTWPGIDFYVLTSVPSREQRLPGDEELLEDYSVRVDVHSCVWLSETGQFCEVWEQLSY